MKAGAAYAGHQRGWAAGLLEAGGLWLSILLLGVLLITGVLDHWRQLELQTLERTQLELTLLEIKGGLEVDLALGMDLHNNPRIQTLLESSLEKDAQLYSLEVLDENGLTLFSTDRGVIGEPLAPHAQAAAQQGAEQQTTWHTQIASTPVMGVAVRGPFGEVSGHVSVSYDSRTSDYFAGHALTAHVLATLLATALGGLLAIWLAMRPQRQLLAQQSQGRLAEINALLRAARQRLDDGAARLDEVERIE